MRRIFALFLCLILGALSINEKVFARETADRIIEKSLNDNYKIEYVLNSDWGEGFNAQINLCADKQLDNWTMEFDYSREITEIWNAVISSHEANHYIVKCKEYNTSLEANQMLTIGFNGKGGEATDEITNVTIYSGDRKVDEIDEGE